MFNLNKNIKTDTNRVTLDYVNRHLNVPRKHTGLIDLQTLIKLKTGVSTHETLYKLHHRHQDPSKTHKTDGWKKQF